ncbi:MAG: hypothetical protein K1W40_13995 [Schaedlerella sp.]|jgi:hypothetical protein|uniref:hypothetical protein n=1 Tax=Clostridia TaxID=186801 RepID=UPI0003373DF5|nr:hypothetical protein [Eubacterium sp. 14-2]EOS23327.1 hypothetical protein C806_02832 [Lachnospiraceae bacterium 3-1]EOT26968.1 hypothetical protein C805_01071 [Eubacterium sp. 14-2]
MERMTGKETVKNMEHLVKLLHKEWERSGRTKAEVSIDITDKNKVGAKLTAEIQERQKQLETAGMDFKECMALSKENFILLRLARKIKKAEDRAGRRENAVSFTVEMDKEEYKLFSMLIKVQEA